MQHNAEEEGPNRKGYKQAVNKFTDRVSQDVHALMGRKTTVIAGTEPTLLFHWNLMHSTTICRLRLT